MKFLNYLKHGVPYNIKEQFMSKGHPNRPGTLLDNKGEVKAVVFHYTANDNIGADAMANARYFGRAYVTGTYLEGGKLICDFCEAGTKRMQVLNGHDVELHTAFRYGSTQLIADMKQVVICAPYKRGQAEVTWGAGDRNMPYTDLNKGQQEIARTLYGNRQNYKVVGIEICNNNVIPNSDIDWDTSVTVAIDFVCHWLIEDGYWVGKEDVLASIPVNRDPRDMIRLHRHFDLTGKRCPLPLVDNEMDWQELCQIITDRVNSAYDKRR